MKLYKWSCTLSTQPSLMVIPATPIVQCNRQEIDSIWRWYYSDVTSFACIHHAPSLFLSFSLYLCVCFVQGNCITLVFHVTTTTVKNHNSSITESPLATLLLPEPPVSLFLKLEKEENMNPKKGKGRKY